MIWQSQEAAPLSASQVREILSQLVEVVGTSPGPDIYIDEAAFRVAAYNESKHLIIVERRVLEICARMEEKRGKAALAFLLGHEYIHYLRRHPFPTGQEKGFISTIYNSGFIEEEREADHQGAFLAYLAGYKGLERAVPEFLALLYDDPVYHTAIQTAYYPSLDERKQSFKEAMELGKKLGVLYESAHMLHAAGYYVEAISMYKYLQGFTSSLDLIQDELTARLLLAISELGPAISPLSYPFELSEARLVPKSEKGPREVRPQLHLIVSKLEKCLADFNHTDFTTHLLLASCYELLDQLENEDSFWIKWNTTFEQKFKLHLKLGMQYAASSTDSAKILVTEGIALMHRDQKEKAERTFEFALELAEKPSLVKQIQRNLAFVNNKIGAIGFNMRWRKHPAINGIDLNSMECAFAAQSKSSSLYLDEQQAIFADIQWLEGSIFLKIGTRKNCIFLHRIQSDTILTHKGLHIGNNWGLIMAQYGSSGRERALKASKRLVAYDDRGMIFLLDEADKLSEWALIRSSEFE